jgi:hypothetical protein
MEEIRLWKIVDKKGATPRSATPLDKVAQPMMEQDFEALLTATPDLLMPDLVLVGRQIETPTGALDLLGVDEDGRLVVFELKRGSLRRDAVAQAIDYGSYLAELKPEGLRELISRNLGKVGIEQIEDFGQWYQDKFPDFRIDDIGSPRIVLVGLAVDEGAKRMVTFLAKTGLDISLITFQAFRQGDDLLLARQVEVQSPSVDSQSGEKKLSNQLQLKKLLQRLGIEQNYSELIAAIKQGLGAEAYQFPNQSGNTFYLSEVSATGSPIRRAYISLVAPKNGDGKLQVALQDRAIKAATEKAIEQAATDMKSRFALKGSWGGEILIDGREPVSKYAGSLTSISQAIANGWKAKMAKQAQAEASELSSIHDEFGVHPDAETIKVS